MNLHFPCQKFAQSAMSLRFPLPKIRTFRFSLHTSRLSLRGEVTMVALKFAMIIGSAEALPILCVRYFRCERERERYRQRERDGSDLTIVALKLAMNLHFPCQKFAQSAMSLRFPLPKIRTFRFSLHTSRLSLRGEVTMVALKFAMSSHFPLPKIVSPSGFVPPLSNGTSRATSDRKPKTNDQILPSPIFLPIEKLNQINTKNYWK